MHSLSKVRSENRWENQNLPDKDSGSDLAIGIDTASSNRNLTGSLVGACLAILTFLLIFLYGRASAGEINDSLFQVTLLVIVGAIFSFGFSGLYYYDLMISLSTSNPTSKSDLRKADAFLIVGIILLVMEPSLIMFTLGLNLVGSVAFALWLVYIFFVLFEASRRQYRTV